MSKLDYESAARENGWTQTPEGWWWREPSDADPEGLADFYFLGSGPFVKRDTVEEACELDGIMPYERDASQAQSRRRTMSDTWRLDPWRAPTLQDGDELLFDEPGRIMRNTDFRSHWFRLVKPRFGFYTLLVHHGGGEERIVIDYSKQIVDALAGLDSDLRYYMLHTLLKVAHESQRAGEGAATQRYRTAFAEGRLRKRKMPDRDACKIWIEPAKLKT